MHGNTKASKSTKATWLNLLIEKIVNFDEQSESRQRAYRYLENFLTSSAYDKIEKQLVIPVLEKGLAIIQYAYLEGLSNYHKAISYYQCLCQLAEQHHEALLQCQYLMAIGDAHHHQIKQNITRPFERSWTLDALYAYQQTLKIAILHSQSAMVQFASEQLDALEATISQQLTHQCFVEREKALWQDWRTLVPDMLMLKETVSGDTLSQLCIRTRAAWQPLLGFGDYEVGNHFQQKLEDYIQEEAYTNLEQALGIYWYEAYEQLLSVLAGYLETELFQIEAVDGAHLPLASADNALRVYYHQQFNLNKVTCFIGHYLPLLYECFEKQADIPNVVIELWLQLKSSSQLDLWGQVSQESSARKMLSIIPTLQEKLLLFDEYIINLPVGYRESANKILTDIHSHIDTIETCHKILEESLPLWASDFEHKVSIVSMPSAVWRCHQKRLKDIRNVLPDFMTYHGSWPENHVTQVVKACRDRLQGGFQQLIEGIFSATVQILGPIHDDSFRLLLLGSFSQQTLTPYSDIEYALDINDQSNHSKFFEEYVKLFCELFNFNVYMLGEWTRPDITHTGFCIDQGGNPIFTPELRTSAQKLLAQINPLSGREDCPALEDTLRFSLLSPLFVANSRGEVLTQDSNYYYDACQKLQYEIFDVLKYRQYFVNDIPQDSYTFLRKHQPFHRVLALSSLAYNLCQLEELAKRPMGAMPSGNYASLGSCIHIKQLEKTLTYIVHNIALYQHPLKQITLTRTLSALKHPLLQSELEEALAILAIIRFRQQYFYQQQCDPEIVLAPGVENPNNYYQLTEEEYQRIRLVEMRFIRPFYYLLSRWFIDGNIQDRLNQLNQIDPAIDAMQDLLSYNPTHIPDIIESFIVTCLARDVDIDAINIYETHIHYYLKLPVEYRDCYRETLINVIKSFSDLLQLEKSHSFHLETLLALLEQCPDTSGERLSTKRHSDDWEQTLTDFIQPEIQSDDSLVLLSWLTADVELKQGYLSPLFAQQLLTKDGKLRLDTRDLHGRCLVLPLKNKKGVIIAYAKFYPQYPMRQWAYHTLCQRLSGYSLGMSLAKIQHPQYQQPYPVIITEALGNTFLKTRKAGTSWASIIDEYNAYAFSWKMFETYLFRPQEDKSDNIASKQMLMPEEISSYPISFDSDMLFSKVTLTREHVELNSILLFFDRLMQAPLDPLACAMYSVLDVYQVIQTWLRDLCRMESKCVGANLDCLFNADQVARFSRQGVRKVGKQTYNLFCDPRKLFEAHTVGDLHQRGRRLYDFLNAKENQGSLNATNLFGDLEPQLMQHYRIASEYSEDIDERFNALPNLFIKEKDKTSGQWVSQSRQIKSHKTVPEFLSFRQAPYQYNAKTAEQALKVHQQLNDYDNTIRQAYQVLQEHHQLDLFEALVHQGDGYAVEKILKNLDWSDLDQSIKKELLELIQLIPLHDLCLNHCDCLDHRVLNKLIKRSPDLSKLTLRYCSPLSKDLFVLLAGHPNLMKISIIGGLFKEVNSVSIASLLHIKQPYPYLRVLHLMDCPELNRVTFEAPQVYDVSFTGCCQLLDLSLQLPRLQQGDFSLCHSLIEPVLKHALEPSEQLKQLKLHECGSYNMYEYKIKERCPALLNVLMSASIRFVDQIRDIDFVNDKTLSLILYQSDLNSLDEIISILRVMQISVSVGEFSIGADVKELSDQQLKRLLMILPKLKDLDISHCSSLTKKSLFAISEYCQHLEKLTASGLSAVTKISGDFPRRCSPRERG